MGSWTLARCCPAALERGRFVRELRWLVGRLAEAARARGIAAWHAGESVDDAVAAVRARFGARPGALLVKGSRGMRLERVVAALADAPVGDPSSAGDV